MLMGSVFTQHSLHRERESERERKREGEREGERERREKWEIA
jgi:hypothetical protein